MPNKRYETQGETQVIIEEKLREPQKARVLLLNDNYTSMEFVVHILMEVFRKNYREATAIMLNVHEKGRGVCGVYPLEIAETKVTVVHARARAAGFPLRCAVEPI